MKRSSMFGMCLVCVVAVAMASGCGKKDKSTSSDDSAKVGDLDKSKDSKKADDTNKANQTPKADDAKKADDSKSAIAAKPVDTWKNYTDEALGFSVDGPVAPEKGQEQMPTAVGTLTGYTFGFTPPGAQGAMIVMVTPAPVLEGADLDVKQILDDGQAGALATMAGTLTAQEDIELGGSPGRMFRFAAKPQGIAASGYVKVFLRDSVLHQVMMVHADASPDFKAQGERFVDSFKLLPKKAK